MQKMMRQHGYRAIMVCLALLVIGTSMFFIHGSAQRSSAYADQCAYLKSGDDILCQMRTAGEIYARDGLAAAVAYARGVTKGVQTSGTCHLLMHSIGTAAYKKTRDLPGLLKESQNFCSAGFFHGALEAYAYETGSREVTPGLLEACNEFSAQGLNAHSWECIHGVGHAVMFVYKNDIFRSIRACDELARAWERDICYFGAFMENMYQHDGKRYSRDTKFVDHEDPTYPCTTVDGRYKKICYLFPGNSALLELITDRNVGVADLEVEDFQNTIVGTCLAIEGPEEYRLNCMRGVAVYSYIAFPNDFAKLRAVCEVLHDETRLDTCYGHIAKTIERYDIENTGRAMRFCTALPPGHSDACARTVEEWWYEPLDR